MTEKWKTPLLDELEKGTWPSFVKELKLSAKSPMTNDLLGVLARHRVVHLELAAPDLEQTFLDFYDEADAT